MLFTWKCRLLITFANSLDPDQFGQNVRPDSDHLNCLTPGPEVIKFEYSLKIKIKHNDWLLADTRFILSLRISSSFITSGPGGDHIPERFFKMLIFKEKKNQQTIKTSWKIY